MLLRQSSEPRGIRNNNPLNIRKNAANNWQGQVGDDGAFVKFDTAINGIRAGAKLIKNYNALYGINTIEGIIKRFAPPEENKTGAYIEHVYSKLGLSRGAVVTLANYPKLIETMILHENGVQPYSLQTISAGIAAA